MQFSLSENVVIQKDKIKITASYHKLVIWPKALFKNFTYTMYTKMRSYNYIVLTILFDTERTYLYLLRFCMVTDIQDFCISMTYLIQLIQKNSTYCVFEW